LLELDRFGRLGRLTFLAEGNRRRHAKERRGYQKCEQAMTSARSGTSDH